MTELDRASLDRVLPSTPGSADWDDVLSRARVRHGAVGAGARRARCGGARRRRGNRLCVRHRARLLPRHGPHHCGRLSGLVARRADRLHQQPRRRRRDPRHERRRERAAKPDARIGARDRRLSGLVAHSAEDRLRKRPLRGRARRVRWHHDDLRHERRREREAEAGSRRENEGGVDRAAHTRGRPAWSPDGRRIAFVSDRDGNFEVYVMNADGSGQRNLTRNAGIRQRSCLVARRAEDRLRAQPRRPLARRRDLRHERRRQRAAQPDGPVGERPRS